MSSPAAPTGPESVPYPRQGHSGGYMSAVLPLMILPAPPRSSPIGIESRSSALLQGWSHRGRSDPPVPSSLPGLGAVPWHSAAKRDCTQNMARQVRSRRTCTSIERRLDDWTVELPIWPSVASSDQGLSGTLCIAAAVRVLFATKWADLRRAVPCRRHAQGRSIS